MVCGSGLNPEGCAQEGLNCVVCGSGLYPEGRAQEGTKLCGLLRWFVS